MQRLPYALLGTGFLVLAIAATGWFILPEIIGSSSWKIGELQGGLKLWEFKKEVKTESYLKINLFHVNNPQEVLEGKKPSLKEVGPYVYKRIKTRTTVSVGEDNETATYKDHDEYYFQPEMSSGSESDIVTILNVPWVGLAQEMAAMSTISRLLVMGIVSRHNETIFMTRPVGEILFGGYYHHIIATFASITGETYMPNNTFGLFYGRNNTFLDEREISLGTNNPLDFGRTLKWKGQTEMEWWESDHCNQFKGTDWNMFAPGITPTTSLDIFMNDMCRHIKFTYDHNIFYKSIPGYRFKIPGSEFRDPRANPENMCYCTQPGTDDENCPKDGVFQINTCSKGASVLLSFPHFFTGDPEYLEKVDGLQPDPNLHESFIDVEPKTGELLESSKKIQVNLHLRPLRSVSDFRKVPNLIFPVMWTDDLTILPDSQVPKLQSQLPSTATVIKLVSVGMMAAGCVMLIVGCLVFFMRLRKKNYSV